MAHESQHRVRMPVVSDGARSRPSARPPWDDGGTGFAAGSPCARWLRGRPRSSRAGWNRARKARAGESGRRGCPVARARVPTSRWWRNCVQHAAASRSMIAGAGSIPFCLESRFCSACARSSSIWYSITWSSVPIRGSKSRGNAMSRIKRKPVPPPALYTNVLLERHDRLGWRRSC